MNSNRSTAIDVKADSRNAATKALTGSATSRRLVRKAKPKSEKKALPSNQPPLTDSQSTRERYETAVTKLKESLSHRRKEWGSFEYPELEELSEQTEFLRFREQVGKVLTARNNSSINPTWWTKCKAAVESLFQAAVPFARHALLMGRETQVVRILNYLVLMADLESVRITLRRFTASNDGMTTILSRLLIAKIAECEISRKAEVEKTLNFIHRQLSNLNVIHNLPESQKLPIELENRAIDVKSAALTYIAVHLRHESSQIGNYPYLYR
jgi:hypothetical protein